MVGGSAQCRSARGDDLAARIISAGTTPPLRSESMYWTVLVLAGLFEIAWAVGLKYTEGFTRLIPSVLTGAAMVISIVLLAIATKKLPLGTAYAVWTGIGAVGAVTLGIVLFGESAQPLRLLCVGLIVVGILGLKLTSAG
jgi:quaternary ammonium compound-resistance protein SugE